MSLPLRLPRPLTFTLAIATVIVCAGSHLSRHADGAPAVHPAAEAANNVVVERVYPTADELPENLLRLYVYFSKPMRPDVTAGSVRLVDQDGNAISDAFLETPAGLWSRDRRRLTVLLNPGRIKSGLNASNAMGPAIREGSRYSVEIAAGAMALDGSKLAETYVKTFEVLGPDRRSPRPERWTLSEPSLGSLDPLTVFLDEPVDHASLAYRIRVVDASGGVVPGRVVIQQQEQRWVLKPGEPWVAGAYALRVEHELEDLAGNRPTRLFEQRGHNAPGAAAHQIPIHIAPRSKRSD